MNEVVFANPYRKTGVTIANAERSFNIANIINNVAICGEINKLIQKRHGVPENTAPQQTDTSDQLIKLKQLLDSGVITQEDFDAKKKQLLGL